MQEITKPIIIESETSNLRSSSADNTSSINKSNKFLGNLIPKLLFGVLALVIVYEIFIGVKTLTKPIPKPKELTSIGGGKITLVARKKQYKAGENVPVTIGFSSGKYPVVGVDLVLKYNPKILEIADKDLVKGPVFSEYPLLTVDSKAGIIRISGISDPGKSFISTGVFANLKFKAKGKGQAALIVDYSPGKTDESNIIQASSNSKDILEKANSLQITVI